MASPVKGVEVNEFSRFIDHTFATPWETFISDIEKALRSIQGHRSVSSSNSSRSTMEYMGMEFAVQKEVVGDNCWGIPEKLLRLLPRTNEPAIFLYPNDHTTFVDLNMRGSILSAFSIAIRSVPDLIYPVFFTLHPLRAETVDWIGYRPIISNNEYNQKVVNWSRYETLSMPVSKLSEKHPLFFFDGIRKVYQRRIAAVGLESDQRIVEQFVTQITHFYQFDISKWLGNSDKVIGRAKSTIIPNVLNRDMDELLRMLLLRKLSFNMEMLHAMSVSLDYRESNQHGIIDNESYSTLLPSRQAPQQFRLFPIWKSTEVQQPFSEHETMILPWKAQSIRNLLVFLILASFTKKQGDAGYNFENNYTLDEMMQGVHYEDMAELVGHLSVPTQTAFYHKIPTTNIAAAASSSSTGAGNSYGSSSRSSSRSMTPLPSMMFPMSVSEVASPKVSHASTATPSTSTHTNNTNSGRGRGQSLSSMSSNASLATTGNVSQPGGNAPSTTDSHQATQAIENDRYFQPILRYLFQTEPSAPLAELLGSNTSRVSQRGKHHGPGMFLDAVDASNTDQFFSSEAAGDGRSSSSHLPELPIPSDGVHIWLEQFAVIAGLLPTKTTNIVRLWQHCLRELQQHFDMQTPVPAFAHIVGNITTASTNVGNSNSNNIHNDSSSALEEDEVLAKRRAFIAAERTKPLYARLLWEDVLYQKGIEEDISVTMPHPPADSPFVPSYLRPLNSSSSSSAGNTTEITGKNSSEYSSVLLQQLQMVHFCTVVQNEPVHCVTPASQSSNHSNNVKDPPTLLRRIPLTEDMLAMQHHISQKILHETSRTFQANPMLKFQVILPNLVAHMQSFKTCNPHATVKDFYHWYGLDQAPASLFATILDDETSSSLAANPVVPLSKESTTESVVVATHLVPSDSNKGNEEEKDGDDREEESGPSSFSDPVAPAYLASFANASDINKAVNESQKNNEGDSAVNNDVHESKNTRNMNTSERMEERLLQELDIIWGQYCSTDGRVEGSAAEVISKATFSAEKEVTKAMAALERMSVAGLAEELLYLATCHSWRMLQHTVVSLSSEEARQLAKAALTPLVQRIEDLHRLRARYPSSSYTPIMKRTFLQSLTTRQGGEQDHAYTSRSDTDSSAAGVTTPLTIKTPTTSAGTNAPPSASAASFTAVTSLLELVQCYDKLAEAMAKVEDTIHRLIQLQPVNATLVSDTLSNDTSDNGNNTNNRARKSSSARKVTVTKSSSQPSVASPTAASRKPKKSRWWKVLRNWLPSHALSTNYNNSNHAYQLQEEHEKVVLLQRMKTLTLSPEASTNQTTDWHSTDGRELGAPFAKKFVLKALTATSLPLQDDRRGTGKAKNRTNLTKSANTTTVSGDKVATPVKLEFDDENHEAGAHHNIHGTGDEDEENYTSSDTEEDAERHETSPTIYTTNTESYDIALTVYSDRQELQALWEYLEDE